jgi:hypothetical protein
MTAAEARRATVRLVRQARAAGKTVSTEDVQRTTGRSARQARRLLALAVMEGGKGQFPAQPLTIRLTPPG